MNTQPRISFAATKEEFGLVHLITMRARADRLISRGEMLDTNMDILAAHLNGCRLDLLALLAANGLDFAHDVRGITRHVNRRTGALEDCFLPRCAARVDATA